MKRALRTFNYKALVMGFSLLLISTASLIARQVPVVDAKIVAQNFYAQSTSLENRIAELKYTSYNSVGNALYYVFNVGEGFVIVSADDVAYPIIGYSTEHDFEFPNAQSPAAYWLTKRQNELDFLIKNNISSNIEIDAAWSSYTNYQSNQNKKTVSTNLLAPLLSSKWNQSPYYNSMCPGSSVTGCVATTMAQIMRYWQYPSHGTGSSSYASNYGTLSANYSASTYNWNNMPMVVTAQNTDVALINYHCGISVEMNYSPSGSSAWVINLDSPISAEHSYVTYFGYDATKISGVYRNSYSDPTWINMLKSDLNLSRPVQYVGSGSQGGHTWVCDGYDQNNFFHMNWGWGGSSDGYFNIDALNPSGDDFNQFQQALFGIVPMASNSIDAGLLSISPPQNACTSNLYSPTIKFRNYGANPLTSCNINYKLDNGSMQTVAWTGSLVTGQSASITIPNYVLTNASHSFVCNITNANNGVDGNSANDQMTYSFSTFSSDNLPISEGFENSAITSTHWNIIPSNGANWAFTAQAFSGGSKSLMINNLVNTPGNVSVLQGLNSYNFSSTIDPMIYFKIAYQQKNVNNNDKLSLQISNDCGTTWWTKWSKQGSALATTPILSNNNFVPTQNDFKQYVVPGIYSTNAVLRWVFSADAANPGNNIYIDDINIYDTSAVVTNIGANKNILNTLDMQLYPNPSNGDVYLKFNLSDASIIEISITDLCGKQMTTVDKIIYSLGQKTVKINNENNFPKGIYLVSLSVNGVRNTKKLVID